MKRTQETVHKRKPVRALLVLLPHRRIYWHKHFHGLLDIALVFVQNRHQQVLMGPRAWVCIVHVCVCAEAKSRYCKICILW